MDTESLQCLRRYDSNNVSISELAYSSLKGSTDLDVAAKIFFVNQANIKLKMLKVDLKGGSIRIEPGALHFMKGDLSLTSNIAGGVMRGILRKIATGETLFQSTISGTGEIHLEPTFGHFLILEIDNDSVIVDTGSFFAASEGIEVSAKIQRNISSALFGGEGLFQAEAKGTGILVLKSPVPSEEMMAIELGAGEKLSIDGNFAVARTSTVTFAAEKSAKSLFTSVTSGELLLQTFTGPGIVWIAPTQGVYSNISTATSSTDIQASAGSSGTRS